MTFRLFSRLFPWAFSLGVCGLTFLTVACRPNADTSRHVELIPSTQPLDAASTFEVRFDQPVIAAALVGDVRMESPIEITPRLRGAFAWTSQRGGTFTPAEPLVLGIQYTFTLRPGLTNAAGAPLEANLSRVLSTPAFGITSIGAPFQAGSVPVSPVVRVFFNAAVEAATAAPHFEFTSSAGRIVPARVTQGTMEERAGAYDVGSRKDRLTWDEWFTWTRQTNQPGLRPPMPSELDSPTNPAPNLLLVCPAQPLGVDTNWTLVMRRGLPSSDHRLSLDAEGRHPLGAVSAFALSEASFQNSVSHGRRIQLRFSHPLPPGITNGFAGWIQISPPVSNLTAEVWLSQLALHGDFELKQEYTVVALAGLPSAGGVPLEESWTNVLSAEPIPPRLYFPAVLTDQFASGRRELPLLVMNVDRVRIRAKRVAEGMVPHALQGFGKTYRVKDEQGNYAAVPYDLVPGRTVFNEVLTGTRQVDESVTIALDWNRILGGRRSGTVLLSAEREVVNYDERHSMNLPWRTPSGTRSCPVTVTETLGTEALVQLTDLGLVWKNSTNETFAFVFSLETGQPVPGAEVLLKSEENEPLGRTVSDLSGIARLPLVEEAAWLTVRATNDFLAVNCRQENVPLYRFDLPGRWSDSGSARQVKLFTERDLYRPGETIHLQGVVRDWVGDEIQLPRTNQGSLKLRDYRDSVSLATNFTLSPWGTFQFDFTLPADAARGRYDFEVRLGEEAAYHGVHVQDFKPRAFEIELKARPSYAAAEAVRIPLSASYLMGKPVSQGRVRWTMQFNDEAPRFPTAESFEFARCWRESGWGRSVAGGTLTGAADLDGTNGLVLTLDPGTNALSPQPRHAVLEVQVTDANQQTLSQGTEFVRHSSEFYLGLAAQSTVWPLGKELSLHALALRPDGTGWPDPVKATWRMFRVDWQTARYQGAGGATAVRSDPLITNVLTREINVAPGRLPLGGQWEAATEMKFTPDQAGTYIAELSAEDSGGRPVVCSRDVSVFAMNYQGGWDYRDETTLEFTPDKAVYAPGDTATLLLKSPISGTALVTVERSQVRRAFVTEVRGNAPAIQVPILPGDAPNVAVFVTLLRGGADSPAKFKAPSYRLGARNLTVEDPARRLQVSVTSSATNYLPAAPVTLTAVVRDAAGAPVRDAEVALYAVDDGVLGMSDYHLPDLFACFYEARPILTRSGLSLPLLLPENPAELRFSNKGYIGGGGGRQHVRQNFAACAFWNATLHTDGDGRVRGEFAAPDAVTRYRAFAVALTKDHRFGGGESSFTISKPLLVEPSLPLFARRTDRIAARAVIMNQTDAAGEVEVTLAPDAHARLSGGAAAVQKVHVPPRGSVPVGFPVEFVATGSSTWTWQARFLGPGAPDFTDAVRSTLKVEPAMARLTDYLSFTVSGSTNLLAGANPQMLRGDGDLQLTLANSRLVGLADTVPQLLHYPYGCAEQTASSLLPWVVLRGTPALAPLWAERVGQDPLVAGAAGVRRLLGMRTYGGIGYWPGAGSPMPFATAYGTLVLAQAAANGFTVPEDALKELCEGMTRNLPDWQTHRAQLPEACLALYAMAVAGQAQPAWHEKLFEQRGSLGGEARSLLALAIQRADGPDAMIETLLTEPAATNAPALDFASPRRAEALRLLAWLRFRPDHKEIPRWVDALVASLSGSRHGSTQDHAWTLLALCAYADECEAELKEIRGTFTWLGTTNAFALNESNRLAAFTLPFTNLDAAAQLPLRLEGGGPLFVRARLSTVPPEAPQAAQDHGFTVTRTYAGWGVTNQPLDLAALTVGDRVVVTLQVSVPQPSAFVAVDDALPAVLEAVLPEFRSLPGVSLPFAEDADGFASFRELRADRALFFGDDVPSGRYVIRYLARVRCTGNVVAPAARAETMYEPGRFGLSASSEILIPPVE